MIGGDRKTYGQMCALAMALDRVGDRWTMLILRELLGGPARFGELRNSLPGIATNLLTTRLRRMQEDGLVSRLGRGQQTTYQLTEVGAGIRPALEALGQWGHGLGPHGPAEPIQSARSLAMPLNAMMGWAAEMGAGLGASVLQLDFGQEALTLRSVPHVEVTVGQHPSPHARAASSLEAMSTALLEGRVDAQAISHIEGDASVTERFIALLTAILAETPTPDWTG